MSTATAAQPVAMTSQTDGKVLEVRDISKSFGGVHAVRGVTFDVREGEIHG